jgi:hypothetical protein
MNAGVLAMEYEATVDGWESRSVPIVNQERLLNEAIVFK